MFDIGFWEMALIGVIALLVVGPERLPALARNVGLWVGRIRRYVAHVKQDIEREIHADEMREFLNNPSQLDELKSVADDTAQAVQDLRRGLDDAARDVQSHEPSSPTSTPPAKLESSATSSPESAFDAEQLRPSTPQGEHTASDSTHSVTSEHEDTPGSERGR